MTAQILTPDPIPGIEKFWNQVDVTIPENLTDVLVTHSVGGSLTVDIAYRRDDQWILTGSDPDEIIDPVAWMVLPLAHKENI